MTDYDFHQLSPYDLEILARDLLQAHWGVTIESFKTGRDGGIDLRHATMQDTTIVQVKHYQKPGLDGLLRELKKEAAKVATLKPSRYVLVTSVPLSAANKESIVEIIGAEFLSAQDVMGSEDINNLLGQHEEVEVRHFKLWLASTAVLGRVLHNAEYTRTEFKVRQVYEDARRYVQSGAFPEALRKLDETGVVIITGPPGVGKSTLANLLLYQHAESGYQPVLIEQDIQEGQKLFQLDVKQLFYFDDFMGATFLGERSSPGGVKDRALLDFIAMIRAAPTARLILTTREHIYSQAINRSERLRQSDLDGLRVVLHLSSFTLGEKAQILYNHLYFSDLPWEYQEELLRDDFYFHIIRHEKFNPRLIEWLSSYRLIKDVPVEEYQGFVEGLLQDPSEIWRHAYEVELTDAGRSLLLTLFSFGGTALDQSLQPAFANLHRERALRYRFRTDPADYQRARRELAGAFIEPYMEKSVRW